MKTNPLIPAAVRREILLSQNFESVKKVADSRPDSNNIFDFVVYLKKLLVVSISTLFSVIVSITI